MGKMNQQLQTADGSAGDAAWSALHCRRFANDDELVASFGTWGMQLQQLKPETGTRWTGAAQWGDLRLWTTRLSGRYRVRSGIPRQSVLVQLELGTARSRRLGGTTLQTDDIVLGLPALELDAVLSEKHHGMSLVLPAAAVAEALSLRAPEARKVMKSTWPHILSGCGPRVEALRRLAYAAFAPGDLTPARRLVLAELLDTLAGTFLASWHGEAGATLRTASFPRRHVVQRVEEYMRANLARPLMLHDLCRAGGASERTIEYAFSDTYGVGVSQYLKLLRLNEVRGVFKARTADAEGVASVAHRHGFWHMGHFCADYRRLFGETPGQTRGRTRIRASGRISPSSCRG